jgi:hypothetical protein
LFAKLEDADAFCERFGGEQLPVTQQAGDAKPAP